MIAVILKFVFFYFLFTFLKSLVKGWFTIKGPIKDLQKMKRKMEHENRTSSKGQNSSNSQTIEAEYRVLKD